VNAGSEWPSSAWTRLAAVIADVDERRELFAAALWPTPVELPDEPPALGRFSARDRAAAVDLVVRRHVPTSVVAERLRLTTGAVQRWVKLAEQLEPVRDVEPAVADRVSP
jgi:hypothetical protein